MKQYLKTKSRASYNYKLMERKPPPDKKGILIYFK